METYLYSTYLPPWCKWKILPFIFSTIFWYGIFYITHFMIMYVTSIFNSSVFAFIKGYLILVPAIVDGKIVKCCVWPEVNYVTYLQLSRIFVT